MAINVPNVVRNHPSFQQAEDLVGQELVLQMGAQQETRYRIHMVEPFDGLVRSEFINDFAAREGREVGESFISWLRGFFKLNIIVVAGEDPEDQHVVCIHEVVNAAGKALTVYKLLKDHFLADRDEDFKGRFNQYKAAVNGGYDGKQMLDPRETAVVSVRSSDEDVDMSHRDFNKKPADEKAPNSLWFVYEMT